MVVPLAPNSSYCYALRASTDVARDKFKEAADAAKDVAAGAADRFQDQAGEKQRTGADFVGRLAGNIRDAARAFENDAPFASRSINSAAEYVDEAATRSATEASAMSSTERPISRSGSLQLFSGYRC